MLVAGPSAPGWPSPVAALVAVVTVADAGTPRLGPSETRNRWRRYRQGRASSDDLQLCEELRCGELELAPRIWPWARLSAINSIWSQEGPWPTTAPLSPADMKKVVQVKESYLTHVPKIIVTYDKWDYRRIMRHIWDWIRVLHLTCKIMDDGGLI
jgi:hypothetical protein